MNSKNLYIAILAIFTGIFLSECKDKWSDHNAVSDPILSKNLLQQINENPDLSKFSEYLATSGYDKVIASSKAFTVWAPTNAAIQAMDPSLVSDDAKLKLFVANHISNQSYLTTSISADVRVKTLNGKGVTFTKTSVDGSPITSADRYVGNGVLHVISQIITPKPNIWQYLMSTSTSQKNELTSLNFNFFDLTRAEQTGIDPATGAPIYKPGTGVIVLNNYLLRNDVNSEDSTYTYIVLTDAAFAAEKAKLAKYFKTTAQDTTDSLVNYYVVKDLAFKGELNSNSFPSTVYSAKDSVKFHLDKNAIVETRKMSNGVVYVMNSINYDLLGTQTDPYTKIKPIKVEGESWLSRTNSTGTQGNRTRINALTGNSFRDFKAENHTASSYTLQYFVNNVLSTKYRVYWVSVNDFQTTPLFPMKITFGRNTATDFTGLTTVTYKNYNEVFIGEYTFGRFYANPFFNNKLRPLNMFLVGNNVTTNAQNTVVLDYIKLVPVL